MSRLSLWLVLTLAGAAEASAIVPARELQPSCATLAHDPDAAGARACALYLRGVLDGAGIAPVEENEEPPASWAQRAARTRIGARLRAREPSRPYCLDADIAPSTLAAQWLRELERLPEAADPAAGTVLDRVLRREYPC